MQHVGGEPEEAGAPPTRVSEGVRTRVVVFGATGTIGRAVVRELVRRGHDVMCVVRPVPEAHDTRRALPPEVEVRFAEVTDVESLEREVFSDEAAIHAVVSCMASRSGRPRDAWAIDHQAHRNVLNAAVGASVRRFVLLSAICVQKPRLAFQHAKLAFERELMNAPIDWVIVRPTAFFKSLSGQLERVRAGRPFLVFGDGTLTSCKPIAEADLARFMVDVLHDPSRSGRILPIGGPGPALTAYQHGELLSAALGRPLRIRRVPVALMDTVVAVLSWLGRWFPALEDRAELARIGRYYATESMLVWNEHQQRYDADATPEFGADTLGAYYERLARGEEHDERGEHAIF